MANNLPFKVLWIEDDESIVLNTQIIADNHNIHLEHFTNWEDAYVELMRNFDEYSAIILDAYCKVRAEQLETEFFVTSVLPRITELFGKKQKDIPWYIYSAGTMEKFDFVVNSALASRREKSEDWGEMLYIKGAIEYEKSNKKLFENIQLVAENKTGNIVLSRHSKAFQYMGKDKLIDAEARKLMKKMLSVLYYPEENVKYENEANSIRKVLEHVFRAANKVGLLPDECFDESNNIHLNDASRYMAGKNTQNSQGVRYGKSGDKKDGGGGDMIFTPQIAQIVQSLLLYSNVGSHTQNQESLGEYNTKELFFGNVLHLCHFIMWFGDYVKAHPDKEANKAMKQSFADSKQNNQLSTSTISASSNSSSQKTSKILVDEEGRQYEGKVISPECDEEGIWHYGKCILSINKWSSGQLKISNIQENVDAKTSSKYPYRAGKLTLVMK